MNTQGRTPQPAEHGPELAFQVKLIQQSSPAQPLAQASIPAEQPLKRERKPSTVRRTLVSHPVLAIKLQDLIPQLSGSSLWSVQESWHAFQLLPCSAYM